jgi:hypothetical protein
VFYSIFQVTIDVSSPEAGVIEKVTAVSRIFDFKNNLHALQVTLIAYLAVWLLF